MDITSFNLANPWRTSSDWEVPSIPREATRSLLEWLDEPEVLILLGARQVGKTSIVYQMIDELLRARRVPPQDIFYFNLDLAHTGELLEDQAAFLRFLIPSRTGTAYVFIDEVQRLDRPGLFMKGIQDLRLPLKLVLTGSSSLDIRARTTESLTGRKQVFHVAPLSFAEYLQSRDPTLATAQLDSSNYMMYLGHLNEHLDHYASWGGYPAVVLTEDRDKKIRRLEEIFDSYVEKDIIALLRIENLPAFRRLAAILAAQQGGLVNIQELSATLGIRRETVARYLSHLEETFVVRSVRPFYSNPRAELTKMHKVYFCDPGLRNLAAGHPGLVGGAGDFGHVLEGVVAGHLQARRDAAQRLGYWRSKSGAEVDFVLASVEPELSAEVKASPLRAPAVTRGFRSFLGKYRPARNLLLNRNLWTATTVEGSQLEAMPLAVFLRSTPPARGPSQVDERIGMAP